MTWPRIDGKQAPAIQVNILTLGHHSNLLSATEHMAWPGPRRLLLWNSFCWWVRYWNNGLGVGGRGGGGGGGGGCACMCECSLPSSHISKTSVLNKHCSVKKNVISFHWHYMTWHWLSMVETETSPQTITHTHQSNTHTHTHTHTQEQDKNIETHYNEVKATGETIFREASTHRQAKQGEADM